jgi:hypothetical protein
MHVAWRCRRLQRASLCVPEAAHRLPLPPERRFYLFVRMVASTPRYWHDQSCCQPNSNYTLQYVRLYVIYRNHTRAYLAVACIVACDRKAQRCLVSGRQSMIPHIDVGSGIKLGMPSGALTRYATYDVVLLTPLCGCVTLQHHW